MSFWRENNRKVSVCLGFFFLASSPFFFSFLKGTLDAVGEVGGLVELASAGTAAAVSTSADMVAECASPEGAVDGSGGRWAGEVAGR